MEGPVTDSFVRALTDRALEMSRNPNDKKTLPLAVHIVCDGNDHLKSLVQTHLKFRRRSTRQKDSAMEEKKQSDTPKPAKTVKAKAARKAKTKVKAPKMVGLLGHKATYVGGTKFVVDKVMGWLKEDGVTEVAIPSPHYPWVGGFVADAAAAAGLKVVVVAPNEQYYTGWLADTKLRFDALLKTGKASIVNLGIKGSLKDAAVYRDITRYIVHPAKMNVSYVVVLTNTPTSMGDVGVAIEEGCTIRPIRIRVLRKLIADKKAQLEAAVAADLEKQSH